MEHLKCDFCSVPDPDPAWDYICDSFEGLLFGVDKEERPTGHSLSYHSNEGWIACATRHALIQAGDKEAVVNRTLDSPCHERPIDTGHREKFAEMIRRFHATFWDTKKQSPTKIYQHESLH